MEPKDSANIHKLLERSEWIMKDVHEIKKDIRDLKSWKFKAVGFLTAIVIGLKVIFGA